MNDMYAVGIYIQNKLIKKILYINILKLGM